jgi:hypothetical protein
MEKANMDLRCTAWTAGVPLWTVAEELGISADTMYRWLRKPLSAERREQFETAIQTLTNTNP